MDAAGVILEANLSASRLLGVDRGRLIRQKFTRFISPESQDAFYLFCRRVFRSKEGQGMDLILRTAAGKRLFVDAVAVRDPQFPREQCRLSLTDITVREQRSAATLKLSENKYRRLFDSLTDAFVSVSMTGQIQEYNSAYRKMLGYTHAELLQLTYTDLTPKKWHNMEAAIVREQILPRGHSEVYEKEYRRKDGTVFPVELRTFLIRDQAGQPEAMWAILRDITERKQAEAVIRKNRKLLLAVEKMGKVGGWELDFKTHKLTWTEAVYDIHEVGHDYEPTVEEAIHFYTPATRPIIQRAVNEAIQHGKAYDLELEIITAKGNRRSVKAIGKPDLKHHRLFGFFQDITERKQAEANIQQLNQVLEQRVQERTGELEQSLEALRKSEEKFRAIAAHTPDRILIQDRQLRYQLVINPPWGMTEAEMLGKTERDVFGKEEADFLQRVKRKVLRTGKPVHLELPFPNPKGPRDYYEGDYIPKRNAAGKVDGVIGYFRNVTERHRMEDSLREAMQFNQQVVNCAREGIVVNDRDLKYLVWNPFMEEITGMPAAEVIGRHPQELFPFLKTSGVIDQRKRILAGELPPPVEVRFNMPRSGRSGWAINTSSPLLNTQGEIIGVIGVVHDITVSKLAAENLRREKEFSENIIATAQIIILNLDDDARIVRFNPYLEQLSGYRLEEVQGKNWFKVFLPDTDWKRIRSRFKNALTGDSTRGTINHIRCKDGTLRLISWNDTRLKDEAGRTIGLVAFGQDITERQQAEEALRKSEERYRVLFDASSDALMTLSPPAWSFTACNATTVAMFRARDDRQFLAVTPWELSPEFQPDGQPSRLAALAAIEQALQRGRHFMEWRHRRFDGGEFPAMISLTRVELAGQVFLQATVRDITERLRLEQEVLSISERECRRIAEDLHDGLGQVLFGATCLVKSLRLDLDKQSRPEAEPLERIQRVINGALVQARQLAKGLHPVAAELNGLMVALGELAGQTRELFGIRCDFEGREPLMIADNTVATHLFRIAQESITNAIKHGRATHIRIGLSQSPAQIQLTIKDNGRGLSTGRSKTSGMGMNIMHYRARMIGGSLTIRPGPRGGTLVQCSVHQPQAKHAKSAGEAGGKKK